MRDLIQVFGRGTQTLLTCKPGVETRHVTCSLFFNVSVCVKHYTRGYHPVRYVFNSVYFVCL